MELSCRNTQVKQKPTNQLIFGEEDNPVNSIELMEHKYATSSFQF